MDIQILRNRGWEKLSEVAPLSAVTPVYRYIYVQVYRPLGRCVAIIDDKVEKLYGNNLHNYFAANDISLIKLVHAGNEINKDIENANNILIDMKNHGGCFYQIF